MRIAMVVSEVAPFSKSGGLADVAAALPAELVRAGHEVMVISPLHRSVRVHPLEATSQRLRVPLRHETMHGGVQKSGYHYFLEQPALYDREGMYGTPKGDYEDNATRFYYLSRGALSFLQSIDWKPDIVHAHDWQTALVPVYMRTVYKDVFAKARSVLTVHNLAYQGLFWHWDMPLLGLDWSLFNWKQMEYYGKINLLKGGLVFADAITTVSPTYAKEIQTAEQGCGLDGVLRDRSDRVFGILNGVDYDGWNPEKDPHIAAPYSVRSPAGKSKCKKALQEHCGLEPKGDVAVFGMVGRLAEQKGIDLLVAAAEALVEKPLQLAILGTGDQRYQDQLTKLAKFHQDRVSVTLAFDEPLAHRIEAGSDFFLMPSRYEPCGLNQLYSLKYGTIPVVRRTGGLADTVRDGETGIAFEPYTPEALVEAVDRALALYADPRAFQKMQKAGMKEDVSWAVSAGKYLELYGRLLNR